MSAVRKYRRRLNAVAGRLSEDSRDYQSTGPPVDVPTPGIQSLVQIVADLQEILIPEHGQQDDQLYAAGPEARTISLLDRVANRLTEQIARALAYDHRQLRIGPGRTDSGAELRDLAEEMTIAFAETIPCIRHLIESDVRAAYEGDPAATGRGEIVLCYPGLEATTVYRIAHELAALDVPLIPRMLSEWAHGRTGIDIHPGATIGPSFFIDHGTGVVIGETCRIGAGVKLYQGVTLGAWSFPRDENGNLIRGEKRHPTLEDEVVVYSNATILGGTTVVGRNSRIGASVSLNRSVPPNTVVTIESPSLRFRDAA